MTPNDLQQLSAEEKRNLLAQLLREKASQVTTRFPLSYAQEALWFLYLTLPESASYNIAFPLRICSSVDIEALRRAFQALIVRHPALRTSFNMAEGVAFQAVHGYQELWFEQVDASGWTASELAEQVQAAYRRPFDLEHGPLLRVHLFTQTEDVHVLLLNIHHIVHDGWSLMLLMEEFRELYAAEVAGKPATLPSVSVSFADFVSRQRQMLVSPAGAALRTYWQQQLSGELPVLNLPTDHPRPKIRSDHGASCYFTLPEDLVPAIRALAQAQGVTLYTLFLAAFQVLLFRYTGQTDLIVGTPTTGRSDLEFARVIGYFVNMIALRADLSGNPPFTAFLSQVRQHVMSALAHQDFPFPLLVERLQPERDPGRTPIFQVSFGLRRMQRAQELARLMMPDARNVRVNWGGLLLEYFNLPQEEGQFDLVLDLVDAPENITGIFKYSTDLFERATITRMIAHFTNLLTSIVRQPEQRIAELNLLSPEERQQIIVDWNNTTPVPLNAPGLDKLFEMHAALAPQAVAVVSGEQQHTYEELNTRANQLAHELMTRGVGPDVLVGVCLERSFEALIAIIAILKAGGAYLPLDPTYPADRLAFMVQDAGIKIILTQAQSLPHLPTGQFQTICLDRNQEVIARHSSQNPGRPAQPEQLAYMLYTSGSTGQPKGVLIEHRNVLALLAGFEQAAPNGSPASLLAEKAGWKPAILTSTALDAALRGTSLCPLGFDVSVWEIFSTLCFGGTLHLLPQNLLLDTAELTGYLVQQHITSAYLPPALLEGVVTQLEQQASQIALNRMLVGVEPIPQGLLQRYRNLSPDLRIVNGYGPTETTICATFFKFQQAAEPERRTPIGKPVAGYQVYLVNEALQPVPVGVSGEIIIGGAGVGRGYLNRPELMAGKFVQTPPSLPPLNQGRDGVGLLYRTGDLGRYLPDGNIEFLGRMDHQVKIRGFRIELGEIEALLAQHPAVQEGVVLAREDHPDEKRLAAYVVLNPAMPLQHPASELRAFLKQRLPDYMIPAAFVVLDALPLTPNGKLDRRALPVPEDLDRTSEQNFVAPRTPNEKLLAEIWASVLKLKQVGIHDNFFELGGDSILSIQIMSRANQAGLHLNPNQFFQYQTIAELAAAANVTTTIQAEQGIVTGTVRLTPVQQWFFRQDFAAPQHWNQAVLLEARQPLNPAFVEQTVQRLLIQHDALRLRFVKNDSAWRQENAEREDAAVFSEIDFSEIPTINQVEAITAAASQLQTSLDISTGPLLRVALFNLGAERSGRLLIIIHHLAVDGVSWRILIEDLQTAYQQLERGQTVQLLPKTTSCQAWAEALMTYSQSPALAAEAEYWINTLSTVQIAPLPRDFEPTSAPTVKFAEKACHCEESSTKQSLDTNEIASQSLAMTSPEEDTAAAERKIMLMLSAEQTHALLHEVHHAYNTNITDILLTALVQGFARWTGQSALLVEVEGHGREAISEQMDVSRTVGWFTSVYPVVLAPTNLEQPGAALKWVKEYLRRIPRRGFNYGVLRYLSPDEDFRRQFDALPQAEVIFNYLGQLDQLLTDSQMFGLAHESVGATRGSANRRPHLLEINSFIAAGMLQMEWTYSTQAHRRETIERVARFVMDALQQLIAHCQLPEAGGYTPSDFPDVDLNQEELDQVLAAV